MTNAIQALQKRGLIETISSPELEHAMTSPIKVYCGFDPTSDCLHLGNLMGVIVLEWFRRYHHHPVFLLGGATGMIGDPGGKMTERVLLSDHDVQSNVKAISKLLRGLLAEHGKGEISFVNNVDWFKDLNVIEFLRDVGKHFRLGPMLGKEMVRTRLQTDEGMSFTEFTYQIMQGYDFLHLFEKQHVHLQIGGSDQWGNITAGIELIRKVTGKQAYGLTFPLLTKSDGQKFGKSEKGAIWLSGEKLSPYDFYQYLYRVSDDDVVKLLKFLTFLPIEDIEMLSTRKHKHDYEPNSLQRILAEEVTKFVHGKEGLHQAETLTKKLSPGKETVLNASTLEAIAKDLPTHSLHYDQVVSKKLLDCLVDINAMASKSEARRMIRNGGLYLNNNKISDEEYVFSADDLVEGKFLLLAAGKKNKMIVKIVK